MTKIQILPLLLVTALISAWTATAQQPKRAASTGGASPHETTSGQDRGRANRVTISYGRPFSKDPKTGEVRKIWGTLVPWGKAWRMGSDEATTLITQKPITFGDTVIPAGAYTLYMVPEESGSSKLVFSKSLGQWGVPVDEKNDFVRVDLKKDSVDQSADQFTIKIEGTDVGGVIKLQWETTQFSAAFAVKK